MISTSIKHVYAVVDITYKDVVAYFKTAAEALHQARSDDYYYKREHAVYRVPVAPFSGGSEWKFVNIDGIDGFVNMSELLAGHYICIVKNLYALMLENPESGVPELTKIFFHIYAARIEKCRANTLSGGANYFLATTETMDVNPECVDTRYFKTVTYPPTALTYLYVPNWHRII